MKEWIERAIDDACSSWLRWACVIGVTLVLGFCVGYWIGHGRVTGIRQTLVAFGWLPLLWLGNPEMFVAYTVTALALYLPAHYESARLRLVCIVANFFVWLVVVQSIVVKTTGGEFFRY